MKLVRFLHSEGESYGVLTDGNVLSLPTLANSLRVLVPATLDILLSLGAEGLRSIEKLKQDATQVEIKAATIKLSDIRILAPLPSPPKIVCLGLNYRDHAAEQGANLPDEPLIFMKPRTAIIGPNQPIVKPSFVQELDYEAELAIVIGRRGKDIELSSAKDHIFGYTAFNDVSARDLQFKDKQWTRAKSFDTFAPMGPCITTANQVKDVGSLKIRTKVNSELRQDSTTQNMVFNVCEIVFHISRVMTLEPGDIITTGTPAGVGFAMKPEPKFLEPGDFVEIEIEDIGILRNGVEAALQS